MHEEDPDSTDLVAGRTRERGQNAGNNHTVHHIHTSEEPNTRFRFFHLGRQSETKSKVPKKRKQSEGKLN